MKNSYKKIAVVSDAVYPFNKGGKEKRIYDVTTRLAEQGYDITIYCMQWWPGDKCLVKDNIKFCAISPLYPLYHGSRRSFRQSIFFALHCLKLITKNFDVLEVDHIPHLVLFTTKLVCLLKRKKMIAVWHESWGLNYWKKYLGRLGYIAYVIERVGVMLPDTIVSVSNHTTNAIIKKLKRKNNVITIPNGLDYKKIQSIAPAALSSDLIYAGRLLLHKHIDALLMATSELKKSNPNISVLIVGDGPERKNLEDFAKQLGITDNVKFLGFLENHDDVYGLMHASKIFVSPSTREGFGITVIEANACGLPVITTNNKNNASKDLIIDNKNGVVYDMTTNLLEQAIEELLIKRKGFKYYMRFAKEYDWSNVINKAVNVY